MLIDRSYFVGELNIPNTGSEAVGSLLDLFIEKYERQFLEKAFGPDVYDEFIAGIQAQPVADKWTKLLAGDTYSNFGGRLRRYHGLVSQAAETLAAVNLVGTISVVVDRGEANDPVSEVNGHPNNATTIPSTLVGKPFKIEQRSVGELRPDEYSITGNQLTLNGQFFNPGDTYFFKSGVLSASVTSGQIKTSPIANYIYYWWMRNTLTQTTSMGEKKGSTENAVNAENFKMVRAWNEMSTKVEELFAYLRANVSVYDWDEYEVWNERFHRLHGHTKFNHFRKVNWANI